MAGELRPGADYGKVPASVLRSHFWFFVVTVTLCEYGNSHLLSPIFQLHHFTSIPHGIPEPRSFSSFLRELSATEIYIQKISISEIVDKLRPYSAAPTKPSSGSEILAKFPNIWQDLTSSIEGSTLSETTLSGSLISDLEACPNCLQSKSRHTRNQEKL
ncbi:hypothetical protein BDZ45DRAFT_745932 [Acephala macrosclerotiorum]|nr:hypothetical protein BDZ45DRAFT_745932 [Acephala macrosclerotiorum]